MMGTTPEQAAAGLVAAGADYAIRLGHASGPGAAAHLRASVPTAGFLPFPRQGPLLTWRPLADATPAPAIGS